MPALTVPKSPTEGGWRTPELELYQIHAHAIQKLVIAALEQARCPGVYPVSTDHAATFAALARSAIAVYLEAVGVTPAAHPEP
jgi:hypothetical protein